jgi:hypothetical protein
VTTLAIACKVVAAAQFVLTPFVRARKIRSL